MVSAMVPGSVFVRMDGEENTVMNASQLMGAVCIYLLHYSHQPLMILSWFYSINWLVCQCFFSLAPTGGFCISPGECICQDGYSGNTCHIGTSISLVWWLIPSSDCIKGLTPLFQNQLSQAHLLNQTSSSLIVHFQPLQLQLLQVHHCKCLHWLSVRYL